MPRFIFTFVRALEDPAGIAADLDALMEQRYADYMKGLVSTPSGQKVTRLHQTLIRSLIEMFEKNIEEREEWSAYISEYASQPQSQASQEWGRLSLPPGTKTSAGRLLISKEELEKVHHQAWEPYRSSTVYHDAARLASQETNSDALKAFSKEKILPLAEAHVAWMKSDALTHSFACNFDPENLDSGLVYLATLSLCIGSTQNKDVCATLYEKWLLGALTDEKNLLLRALILNQNKLANIIKVPRSIPDMYGFWSDLMTQTGDVLGERLETPTMQALLYKSLLQISTPLNTLFAKFAQSGVLPPALLALGALKKSPVVLIDWQGSLTDAAEIIEKASLEALGKKAPYGSKAALKRRVELLGIKGAKIDGIRQKNFVALLDLDELKQIDKSAKVLTQAKQWALAVHHPDDFDKLRFARWRQNLVPSGKATLSLATGALGALLQIFAIGQLSEEFTQAEALGEGQEAAQWRYRAGWVLFAACVFETLGKAFEASPKLMLKLGKGLGDKVVWALKGFGRILGAAAVGVCAYWDGEKFLENRKEGKIGLMVGYATMTILGVINLVLIAVPKVIGSLLIRIGVGVTVGTLALGILLTYFVIGIFINAQEPDPLQKWLEAGVFGRGKPLDLEAELQLLETLGVIKASPKGA